MEGAALDPAPLAGEILRLDDLDTGFSAKNPKRGRPNVVVGVAGAIVYVAPMSTHPNTDGVYLPGDLVEGIDECHVVDFPGKVLRSVATAAETAGFLPRPYLDRVIEQSKQASG